MTYAEEVSDLLYHGKTLDEISAYTPWFRKHVLYLPRNKMGERITEDEGLPAWVKVDRHGRRIIDPGSRVSLKEAMRRVNRDRGLSEEKIDEAVKDFEERNPKMGLGWWT